ncbi:ATP-binding cassette, subfamily C, CydC [Actinobaculum suis]|uniref:ATP-binding cassette, subfamily C, CydC n=1 Tax=Actinobaculum suis TaxID=1657 RepID=A0A1G7E1C1_9ACTO|nr:thiol reductant ABC exporter subunit CydC [Actinobaculum suis]MDY5153269.1 thiol reductant ABC exporter subunit CydC [Actinobaculum suis]SDE57276.1 ATP-binding cassette, subfamily C, CydC [Actinobaculum suis]
MKALPQEERVALRRIIKLLEVNKRDFWLSVLAGAVGIGSAVGLSAVSAWMITRASQMPPVMALSISATAVRALGVSKAVLRYFNRIFSHRVALYGMSSLRTTVYSTLADSSTDVVTSVRRGDLLARMNTDVDAVGELIVKGIQPTWVAFFVSLISVAIVGSLSLPIGIVLLLGLIVSGIVGPYFALKGGRLAEETQVKDRTEISSRALTMLDSADELRISGKLSKLEAAQAHTEAKIYRNRDAAARPQALSIAIDTLAMGATVVLAIIIGSLQLAQGTLSETALAVCVLTPLAAFEGTQPLGEAAIQLVRSGKAAQRILDLLDRARAASSRSETAAAQTTPAARANAGAGVAADAAASGLVAHDLIIGWPDGPDVAGPFNFAFPRGKAVAIVGPSGIGKSTLLFSMSGMLSPHAGSMRLEGREVSRMDRTEVSQLLSLTAEDAHIFETSVLENLRVARPSVTEREAIVLLAEVGLGEWLTQLPDGVHTIMGEDAATISGGERRRLLLARALASPAQYLLLDEPGEHLDPETADPLIRDLLRAGKRTQHPRTIILATHRLTPLDAADHVILLARQENGEVGVAHSGTHAELVASVPEYAWAVAQEAAAPEAIMAETPAADPLLGPTFTAENMPAEAQR